MGCLRIIRFPSLARVFTDMQLAPCHPYLTSGCPLFPFSTDLKAGSCREWWQCAQLQWKDLLHLVMLHGNGVRFIIQVNTPLSNKSRSTPKFCWGDSFVMSSHPVRAEASNHLHSQLEDQVNWVFFVQSKGEKESVARPSHLEPGRSVVMSLMLPTLQWRLLTILPDDLPKASLGTLNHPLKNASPLRSLLYIELPEHSNVQEMTLDIWMTEDWCNWVGCCFEGLVIVGEFSHGDSSSQGKSPKLLRKACEVRSVTISTCTALTMQHVYRHIQTFLVFFCGRTLTTNWRPLTVSVICPL